MSKGERLQIVFLGLSITSSWGNGHATNYRALVTELTNRGHDVTFCERDVPWYAAQRDLSHLPQGNLCLYSSLAELRSRAGDAIRDADLVVLGSCVPEGVAVATLMLELARGVTAFYDIDTPVTLAKLAGGDDEYLAPELIPSFDLYLSFTGGPTLGRLQTEFGARRARAFYCLVDPRRYRPQPQPVRWDLGYLGTYSADRQTELQALLLDVARRLPERRFAVAGPQYPADVEWGPNVARAEHLAPADHPGFYCAQRFTLNITRAAMRRAGWSPSVRLFEAAACGTAMISDRWAGLDQIFTPGEEILIADDTADVVALIEGLDEDRRRQIGARARQRVLAEHTAAARADQLEREVAEINAERGRPHARTRLASGTGIPEVRP